MTIQLKQTLEDTQLADNISKTEELIHNIKDIIKIKRTINIDDYVWTHATLTKVKIALAKISNILKEEEDK